MIKQCSTGAVHQPHEIPPFVSKKAGNLGAIPGIAREKYLKTYRLIYT